MTSQPGEQGRPEALPRGLVAATAGLLVVGAGLRVAMGFESFWLDEAWSHALAMQADSTLDVLRIRIGNNHLLNTLYLYAVGDWVGRGHWIGFRVPSLVAGWLSLVLVWHLASRWGRAEGLLALALTSTSFPLISASAQARGYAGAIVFSLLYFTIARQRPGGREWLVAAALAGTAAVGLLSHPTFVYTMLALILADAARDRSALALLRRHGVPVILAGFLYWVFYVDFELGGGPAYERFVTLRQAFAQTMGLSTRGPLTWLATLLGALLIVRGLVLLQRAGDSRFLFVATQIVLAPSVVVAITNPQLFYARYLLVCFPWFYLLVAIVLADAWRDGRSGRVAAAALLAFFIGANLLHTARVLAEGRNDYERSLAYIDRRTAGPVIEIGSDHDFRNPMVLRFYAARIPSGRPVVYLKRPQWPESGPEWYLRHDWKAGHDPESVHVPAPGLRYERVESFEHGPGDGFQWFIYRRAP